MQLFQMCFCNLVCGVVNDVVNATEMIDRLHDIVDTGAFGGDAKG